MKLKKTSLLEKKKQRKWKPLPSCKLYCWQVSLTNVVREVKMSPYSHSSFCTHPVLGSFWFVWVGICSRSLTGHKANRTGLQNHTQLRIQFTVRVQKTNSNGDSAHPLCPGKGMMWCAHLPHNTTWDIQLSAKIIKWTKTRASGTDTQEAKKPKQVGRQQLRHGADVQVK